MQYLKIFYFLFLLFIFSCINTDNTSLSDAKIAEQQAFTEKIKNVYLEIKEDFDKGYYYGDLDFKMMLFLEDCKDATYFKKVRAMENKMADDINKLELERSTLLKKSSNDYFEKIDLPRLDSITENDYAGSQNSSYKNYFSATDINIFKPGQYANNRYLSQYLLGSFIGIVATHHSDCEGSIKLYSIDDHYKIMDQIELYEGGCFQAAVPDFPYENYIINEEAYFTTTYFHEDGTFTKIIQESFRLKDKNTNKEKVEIGRQYDVTFQIDQNGIFKEIENNSFEKPYVQALLDVEQ